MNPTRKKDPVVAARREVEVLFKSLVETGHAQWHVNDEGQVELHMENGEIYLLGDLGITRLR
ncbi:hypothetical protein [Dyella sp. EPa41]|uniref:hypothetical protein n=1 Tax=Dyella sp. EPa41 TaxID=1561194 RepID=UPI001915B498|nr:hypothetical protein [Dyella sp. EPa41]